MPVLRSAGLGACLTVQLAKSSKQRQYTLLVIFAGALELYHCIEPADSANMKSIHGAISTDLSRL